MKTFLFKNQQQKHQQKGNFIKQRKINKKKTSFNIFCLIYIGYIIYSFLKFHYKRIIQNSKNNLNRTITKTEPIQNLVCVYFYFLIYYSLL